MASDGSTTRRPGGGTVTVVDVTDRERETRPPRTGTLRPPSSSGERGGADGGGALHARHRTVAERRNPIYAARAEQLRINALALDGGRPYVEERLSRFAGESEVDWSGGTRADGISVTGRLEQAHCIPYPGRIADKISQYVFAEDASREGGDAAVLEDITRDGESVGKFMRRVNDVVTACRWCWVGVDSPLFDALNVNLRDRAIKKLRPYWTLYGPDEVVDWKIGPDGRLVWLITELTECVTSDDPYEAAREVRVRNLWQPGLRTRYELDAAGKVAGVEEYPFGLRAVPFVLAGTVSARPYLFDSIEGINRTIMDLESCSRQNFFERVFPQMYLPAGCVDQAARVWRKTAAEAAEMIAGLKYPVLLDKDDAVPGYFQPNSTDLAQIDVKVDKLREAMFECVGLMLRQESRSAQSGESKAWDHLDAEAVLADRSTLLEETETKLATLTHDFDPGIPLWTPRYPRRFDVTDFAEGIAAVVQGAQVSQPPELARLGLRVLYQMYRKLHRTALTPEQEQGIAEAIESFDAAGGPMEPLAPEERQTGGVENG